MRPSKPSEEDIADYIDGRLDGFRRAAVAAWLDVNPERAAEVERQRQLNEALKVLGRDILDEPVPDRLRAVLSGMEGDAASDPPAGTGPPASTAIGGTGGGAVRGRSRRWIGIAALLLIGVAAGWMARSAFDNAPTAFDALLADASYAVAFYSTEPEYAIQFPPDRITDFQAVSQKMFKRSVAPPDLQAVGYTFRGARIAPTGRQTSTFFFFEDRTGRELTVLLWPRAKDSGIGSGSRALGDIAARYWFVDSLGFAVLGKNGANLRRIADVVAAYYEGRPEPEMQ
jgi:anti-sigma factor RsiW